MGCVLNRSHITENVADFKLWPACGPPQPGGCACIHGWQTRPDLSFEFQLRLLVVCNAVNISNGQTCLVKTVAKRSFRQGRVMLVSRETLFLGGSNEYAVAQKAAGGVMIIRG